MAKKILFIVLILFAVYLVISKDRKVDSRQNNLITPIPEQSVLKGHNTIISSQTSIFVPYWSDMNELSKGEIYDRYIYFGIKPGEINTVNLDKFVAQAPENKGLWLTVIMTDTDENLKALNDPAEGQRIGQEIGELAGKYGFKGVVLDLEMSVIPFDDTVEKLNLFVRNFSTMIKDAGLSTGIVVYGDVFYRKRPYDIKILSSMVDEVMVMAYDFHKSRGEPGPNFPFLGKEKYGYDFQTMIKDFTKLVPKEKLTIVFGMFGYEWSVDEKKKPIKLAESLSLNEIKKKFLEKCEWQDCVIKRDQLSGETEINYITSQIQDDFANLYYNIVWFEDEQSVTLKSDWLKKQGIGSVAYWAWGYY